jgi:hypothetical protein
MPLLLTETSDEPLSLTDERGYAQGLIRRIVEKCPKRKSASADERRAQEILRAELQAQGLETELLPFRFNNSLYAVLALHFAVAVLGSAVYFLSAWAALALHLLAAVSYLGDSTYRFFWLRRLLPRRASQNLVATLPADGPVRHRIVLIGHADAAPTGWLFRPQLIRGATNHYYPRPFRFLRKQMLAAVLAISLLAFADLLAALPTGRAMPVLFVGMTVACLVPLVLNLQVVLGNRIVPGASDNLTGCAALPILAHRFAQKKPKDVELVFVATGCEEAGCGGSLHLARAMQQRWEKHKTVIIGLDILTNGELRYKQCGEIVPLPVAPWLYDTLQEVAARDDRWGTLPAFNAPAGSDDAAPFLAHGYQGVCLCCIDPALGVSRNYHLPSDTPDNLEYDYLMDSLDFAEELVSAVIARRKSYAQALANGDALPAVTGEPNPPPLPKPLWSWHTWLWLGPVVGLYCGATLAWEWSTAFAVFRWTWLTFVLTFPTFLLLERFGRNPDKYVACQCYVFLLLTALGATFASLFTHPLVDGVLDAWAAAHPLLRATVLGLILGTTAGVALAHWVRTRKRG